MHRACLGSFERVFVDDTGQLETVKSLTGNVGHRLYAAFKANAHRADIFRYMDHYLRGGLYLDIKTALLEPLERIQERIVAEFKADASLIAHAANLYGWDPAALAASGPPDYFMTAIGTRKDHIFQGILLARPRHPLMLAALHHCFGPTLVDQQDLSGFRYMAFCEELFRVIKADRYQGAGTPLKAGWVLGFGLDPIYLLQKTHEPALKAAQPKGLPNDGHCFRTAGGQMVALTRCWKWNKGWKGDAAGKHDSILRRLPSVLQEVQAAASQGTASGSGGGTTSGSRPRLNLPSRLISLRSKPTSWLPWRRISWTKSWPWLSNWIGRPRLSGGGGGAQEPLPEPCRRMPGLRLLPGPSRKPGRICH